MVKTASDVNWTIVKSEFEALQLEFTWIKEYDPPFNVVFKDDKSYPWLAISSAAEWPRPQITRGQRRKGTRYFGPFGHVRSLRRTVDLDDACASLRSAVEG